MRRKIWSQAARDAGFAPANYETDDQVIDRLRAERDNLPERLRAAEAEVAALRVDKANLISALIAAGHDEDCPVVHGASMDCAGGVPCAGLRRAVSPEVVAERLPEALERRGIARAAFDCLMPHGEAQLLAAVREAMETTDER